MDFSEPYKFSGPTPTFSPDGRYLAAAVEYRLIIRDAETLQVTQLYSCLDRIDHLEWSANSLYILCGLYSRAIIQVWSAEQPDWTCKIDEGPAGVQAARWAPDGGSIIVTAALNIRTTVWLLQERRCQYLPGAKSHDRGTAFSPDGLFMAQLERYDCTDQISIYETSHWSQVRQFKIGTSDAVQLLWSPDGGYLAVADDPLSYKLVIHAPDGRPLGEHVAYTDALGIKTVTWDPSGQFLAVGSYDQAVRVVSDVTWQPLLEGQHPSELSAPPGVALYKEVAGGDDEQQHISLVPKSPDAYRETKSKYIICDLPCSQTKSKYIICDLPVALPSIKPAMDRPNPKLGVGWSRWSPNSQYLATINENMPAVVWIWDMAAGDVGTVLVHAAAVKDMQWAPQGSLLAVVTDSSKVYLWAPAGASVVHIPLRGFQAQGLTWGPRGTSFLLKCKDSFCCAYLASGQ